MIPNRFPQKEDILVYSFTELVTCIWLKDQVCKTKML